MLVASTPFTQAASVAYIESSGGSLSYLSGYGHTVTVINNPIGLTLGALSGYDVVIAASNGFFSEPGNIGDVLADFADSGRGVVLTEFTFQAVWALGGRITTAGYSPFTADPGFDYSYFTPLGTVYDASSPLLTGTVGMNSAFQANVGMNAGGVLVADWSTGRHAVGYTSQASSSVVGLNTFPHEIYADAGAQRLVANAVDFSMSAHGVPEPGFAMLGTTLLLGFWCVGARRRAAN